MQGLPRPLSSLLVSQLRSTALRSCTPSPIASSSRRHASTAAPTEPTPAEKQRAIQQRQLRLMDKAGRIKQNVGSMSGQLPAFANYVRPREWSKVIPAGTPMGSIPSYLIADTKHFVTNMVARNACKKALGKTWESHFKTRALEAYTAANEAFATGRYAKLTPYAGGLLLDTIKSQRSKGFSGLQMSWKLHKLVREEVACARAQELMKKGETIAQITLRFETLQHSPLQAYFALSSTNIFKLCLPILIQSGESRHPSTARSPRAQALSAGSSSAAFSAVFGAFTLATLVSSISFSSGDQKLPLFESS
ncbi:hypothetical protein P7C70_g4660, partial [Phenoliferia sp. Uapishka_3]